MSDKDSNNQPNLAKLVDMRIPLHWLLSGITTVVMVLIGMWYTMGQLSRDVSEMQSTLKAQAAAATAFDRDAYRMNLRLESVEQKVRALEGLPAIPPSK